MENKAPKELHRKKKKKRSRQYDEKRIVYAEI